jgi:membrane-bound serine protease (ClpP class)
MKRSRVRWLASATRHAVCWMALAGATMLASSAPVAGVPSRRSVLRCELAGTIDAGTSAYLVRCLQRAEKDGHQALLLRLDTPGGSLEATQQMVQGLLGARVPVLIWVGPAGARAGSAGTFLVLASHFAGMAEGTRIGAAHPVQWGGGDPGGRDNRHLAAKVENDAAAFAGAVARARGRNVEWAERAVRDSVSASAEEAVRLDVVEMMAPTEVALLASSDGKSLAVGERQVELRTRDADVVNLAPSLKERLLHALANPSLAYLLLLVGGLGLALEMTNPGMIIPGLSGTVCLVLALMAMAALPIRGGAVILVAIGLALLAAELFMGSGALGVSGALLMVLGGLFWLDHLDPRWFTDRSLAVPARLVIPTAVLAGAASIFVFSRVARSRHLPPQLGPGAMGGELGRTLTEVNMEGGEVFVHGERWQAVAAHPIPPDEEIVVLSSEGLTLRIQEVPS